MTLSQEVPGMGIFSLGFSFFFFFSSLVLLLFCAGVGARFGGVRP
jgi:hypothetical protein